MKKSIKNLNAKTIKNTVAVKGGKGTNPLAQGGTIVGVNPLAEY